MVRVLFVLIICSCGSRLVCLPNTLCCTGTNSLVLHLPRGNLETVRPRALVLPAIAAALAARQYGDAWRMAVVNRYAMTNG